MTIDPPDLDLENVPDGYAVDYVYVPKVGKPMLVHNRLPFEFRADAFKKAMDDLRSPRPFVVVVMFKVPPVKFVTEHCCKW